jgi:phosphoglycolate phosphatase
MSKNIIVFDLDGTLVDSAANVSGILNTMRSELGLPSLPRQNFIPWISLGGDILVSKALEIPFHLVRPYTEKFRDNYFDLPTPLETIYSGVVETLDSLSRAGIILSLCTNKPRRLADKVLKDTSLDRFFSFTIAGGDLPTNKPNPTNLLVCLQSNKAVINDAYFIGDSTVDQKTAENANVKFIFYENGYDDGVDKFKTYATFKHHHLLAEILL